MTVAVEPPPGLDGSAAEVLFREARARRRARRRRAGIAVVVVLVVAGTLVAVTSGHGPPPPATGTAAGGHFLAPTSTRGGDTSMIMRLPDGRGFDLTYPTSFHLSTMDMIAAGEVNWPVTSGTLSCCDEYLSPVYGSVRSIFGVAKPIAVYRGAHGQPVPYFSGAQASAPYDEPAFDYLAFQFGNWVVLAMDIVHSGYYTARMSESERATWARSFDAYVDKAGFLIFDPRPPLTVYRGGRTIDAVLRGGGNLIEMSGPTSCQGDSSTQARPTITNPPGLGWCDARVGLRVSITGHATFVNGLETTLGLRAVGRPPRR